MAAESTRIATDLRSQGPVTRKTRSFDGARAMPIVASPPLRGALLVTTRILATFARVRLRNRVAIACSVLDQVAIVLRQKRTRGRVVRAAKVDAEVETTLVVSGATRTDSADAIRASGRGRDVRKRRQRA